ncbi:MAG: hypothetical protein JO113_00055 [Candidatus Eremiobacteraeota bacterium]|nr:hypothetical protein [Candidatus Eremiobacteraeota bacterium]
MKRRSLLVLGALAIAACSGPGGYGLSGSPVAGVRGFQNSVYVSRVVPDGFSLHPPRIHFSSPSEHYKVDRVRGFGPNGKIFENCIRKGVAEVAGAGRQGNTLIADVIPMAPGRCEATFTNGHGDKLRLPVIVAP